MAEAAGADDRPSSSAPFPPSLTQHATHGRTSGTWRPAPALAWEEERSGSALEPTPPRLSQAGAGRQPMATTGVSDMTAPSSPAVAAAAGSQRTSTEQPTRPSSAARWGTAKQGVKLGIKMSSGFSTLRDMGDATEITVRQRRRRRMVGGGGAGSVGHAGCYWAAAARRLDGGHRREHVGPGAGCIMPTWCMCTCQT